jgi:Domain of unknown function (DUF1877)
MATQQNTTTHAIPEHESVIMFALDVAQHELLRRAAEECDRNDECDRFYDLMEEHQKNSKPYVCLHKSWFALHWLMSNACGVETGPLTFLRHGGSPLEEVYQARWFSSDEVKDVWRALEPLTPAVFATHVDLNALAEAVIYPYFWRIPPEQEDIAGWLVADFARVWDLFRVAFVDDRGVVLTTMPFGPYGWGS